MKTYLQRGSKKKSILCFFLYCVNALQRAQNTVLVQLPAPVLNIFSHHLPCFIGEQGQQNVEYTFQFSEHFRDLSIYSLSS